MLLLTRACQRLGIARWVRTLRAPRRADPLDEFAQEATPRHAPGAFAAAATWWLASFAFTALVAVASSTFFTMLRDRVTQPQEFVAPEPSPIEVEFPDYPGAPLLQAAVAAMPDRVTADAMASSLADAAGPPAALPRRASEEVLPRSIPAVSVRSEEPPQFAARRQTPQLVSTAAAGILAPVASESPAADAPPRRIGPAERLAVTTLGGISSAGRLALVLEVTERGEVSRIVSREAVNVDSDVIDAVSGAAMAWRYEPARRAGLPVAARVRVVVELDGR